MGFKSYNELYDLFTVSIVITLFSLKLKVIYKGIDWFENMYVSYVLKPSYIRLEY
jgi:hypothetical protein